MTCRDRRVQALFTGEIVISDKIGPVLRRALVAVAACSLTLVSGTHAYAAPSPAVSTEDEGETDYSTLGESTGVVRLQAAGTTATPRTPRFGPGIDGYAGNDPQDTCDPTEKAGPAALRSLLNATYDLNRAGNITRACGSGGTSEHKEGRALDYMLDSTDTSERNIANTVLDWMLDTDSHGNKHAVARRLGVMYLIWNRKIWSAARASEGWRGYGGSNPHTDHIHVSFSWSGARKQTTWWTAALPSGGSVSGDARADLIVHQLNGDVSLRTNQGGNFDGGRVMTAGWGDFLGQPGQGRLYFADINGDGRTDLLHHANGEVTVRYNQGDHFAGGRVFTSGWENFLGQQPGQGRLYFADINGDGRADLLHHSNGEVTVRYNVGDHFDGGRVFTSGWENFLGYPGQGRLYFADVNGDGQADLLHHSNGDVTVRYNQGDHFDGGRVFTSGWENFMGHPGQGKLYFADVNGDGRADLLHHSNGEVTVRYNEGDHFDGGRVFTSGWGAFMGYPDQGVLYFG